MKVLLFIVVAFFAAGEALKCYECEKCGIPFNKTATNVKETLCAASQKCEKLETKIGDANFTSRGCVLHLGEINTTTDSQLNTKQYLCESNLCNGASSITYSLIPFMAFSVMLMIMSRN